MITKLAWKNIWRNKRRSFITIFAVALAVFFALNMRCMQLGMYDSMVSNMVDNKFGYIQIHANGYWDERIVDNSFFEEDIDVAALERIDAVSIERRLETGA
jgi:ABC-type lipoprotein release transport system permease subunit